MKILGIETSCDETAVALYCTRTGLIKHEVYSQIALHAQYGGVVPELASRDHVRKLTPLIKELLEESQLTQHDIDAIAYTQGPGLIGALLVGACFAKSLAYAWNVPAIGVHHLEAHVLAQGIEHNALQFPFLALLVSGGHSQIIWAKALGEYELLGETLDDAVGEAFDKTAKLLGLAYPGGPQIAALAEQGDANKFAMPRPMTDRPGLDLSFSGLKTSVLNTWMSSDKLPQTKADVAASFQKAVVDTLMIKFERAIKQTQAEQLVIAGGVGANLKLREALKQLAKKYNVHINYPRIEFCTDNAAMVAFTGAQYAMRKQFDLNYSIEVKARWPFT